MCEVVSKIDISAASIQHYAAVAANVSSTAASLGMELDMFINDTEGKISMCPFLCVHFCEVTWCIRSVDDFSVASRSPAVLSSAVLALAFATACQFNRTKAIFYARLVMAPSSVTRN